MGIFLSCCRGSNEEEDSLTVSVEQRRKQAEEAAERRRLENERRGIKDPEKFKRQQAKAQEMEKREMEAAKIGGGNPNLRWTQD
ncbi:uncharacterized protein LOC129606913 [Condylostylus longicornis]|uniref:uncharacterized protein LOC129606913 n=1 Tax=Condylostylus longicornis TaxID=2530218 RepID=UPI00244DD712|nr:uncharacterized protein LOC129606913 [Condylostylus longicornis]